MYKRSSRVQYPCTVCSLESGDGTIQCSGCGEWTHAKCLHVDEVYLQQFIDIDFYCPVCATDKSEFVWDKSIRRVRASRNKAKAVTTERLLVALYNATPKMCPYDADYSTCFEVIMIFYALCNFICCTKILSTQSTSPAWSQSAWSHYGL